MKVLSPIINEYKKDQFDVEYRINEKISTLQSILSSTTQQIQQMLKFKYDSHKITADNIFTEFHTENYLSNYDPEEHLNQQERQEIFGEDDEVLEYEESDFEPDWETETETEIETESETECEEEKEISMINVVRLIPLPK